LWVHQLSAMGRQECQEMGRKQTKGTWKNLTLIHLNN